MRTTSLRMGRLDVPAWGLVTVAAPDSSIVRQYQITGDDVQAVTAGAAPPGCTPDEWLSGRVIVVGRPCLPGMCVANPDGWLMANYGIEEVAGRVDAKIMRIPPSEWELRDGVVCVEAAVADEMGV